MLGFVKLLSIFLEQVIALLFHQACLVKKFPLQDRLKYVVNRTVLDFMPYVSGLITTLRPTWVYVRRKRQEGNVHATNTNSPIPSIPSLLCLHSWHSPICRTRFIPAHLRQRYIASQLPYSCQNSLMALNFQLPRKLIRAILSYLHLFYIPHSRLSESFSMGRSFLSWFVHQAAYIQLR